MLTALILSGLTGLVAFGCIRILRGRSASRVEATLSADTGSSLDQALFHLINDLSRDRAAGSRRTLLSATPPPVRAITNAPVAERTRFPRGTPVEAVTRGTPVEAVTVSFRPRVLATPAHAVPVLGASPPAADFADEVPTASVRAHAVRSELPIRRRSYARS